MNSKLVFFLCLVLTMSGCFASVISSPTGGTRCFCNEANCVRTGYMCKSTLSLCYSIVTPVSSPEGGEGGEGEGGGHGLLLRRSSHGCVDSLPDGACLDGRGDREGRSEADDAPRRTIACCAEDMCNYLDGAGVVVLLSAVTTNGSGAASSHLDFERSVVAAIDGRSRREFWFRVVIVAVPLVGLVLLLLLVAAAVRMLRGGAGGDPRRHHRRRHHGAVVGAAYAPAPAGLDHQPSLPVVYDECGGGGAVCSNHRDFPAVCWVEFSDKQHVFDSRTCKHHKCFDDSGDGSRGRHCCCHCCCCCRCCSSKKTETLDKSAWDSGRKDAPNNNNSATGP